MFNSKVLNYQGVHTYIYIHINWLVVEPYPSEKYEFVSWENQIPNIWENNPNAPSHQPGIIG